MTVLSGYQPKRHHRLNKIVGMDPCGGAYRLDCMCGWKGPLAATVGDADRAWQAHATEKGQTAA